MRIGSGATRWINRACNRECAISVREIAPASGHDIRQEEALMAAESLTATIQSLTPQEQESVRQFVDFLKNKSHPSSPFLAAVDEFIARHPELLRRLAQ